MTAEELVTAKVAAALEGHYVALWRAWGIAWESKSGTEYVEVLRQVTNSPVHYVVRALKDQRTFTLHESYLKVI